MVEARPGWLSRISKFFTRSSPKKETPALSQDEFSALKKSVQKKINRNTIKANRYREYRKIRGALNPRTFTNRLRRIYYGAKRIFNWKPIATRAESARKKWDNLKNSYNIPSYESAKKTH